MLGVAISARARAFNTALRTRVPPPLSPPPPCCRLRGSSRKCIAALEAMEWNPLYEMQLPYGALTAARLNAGEGAVL